MRNLLISTVIQMLLTTAAYAAVLTAGLEMCGAFTFAYACLIGAAAAYLVEKYIIGLE